MGSAGEEPIKLDFDCVVVDGSAAASAGVYALLREQSTGADRVVYLNMPHTPWPREHPPRLDLETTRIQTPSQNPPKPNRAQRRAQRKNR